MQCVHTSCYIFFYKGSVGVPGEVGITGSIGEKVIPFTTLFCIKNSWLILIFHAAYDAGWIEGTPHPGRGLEDGGLSTKH